MLQPRLPSRAAGRVVPLTLAIAMAIAFAASGAGTSAPSRAGAKRAAAKTRTTPGNIVARVQGQAVTLKEVEDRKRVNIEQYRRRTGKDLPAGYDAIFLRIALEEAIGQRLLELDARASGVQVSDAAAESVMKGSNFFHTQGKFDRGRWDAYRAANPAGFREAREEARRFLRFQRHTQTLEARFRPTRAELENELRLRRSRAAIRYALVTPTLFDGRHDPSDEELRAYYRAHQKELEVPPRVVLSFLGLTFPQGTREPEGLAKDSIRTLARTIIARVEGGTPLDSQAVALGLGLRPASWRRGQTTGLFEGQMALAESLLLTPPGRMLPRPVEVAGGVAVVRVERVEPGKQPSLAEAAADLRSRIRSERLAEQDRSSARQYYEAHPDSFGGQAWQVRWAIVDSAQVAIAGPKREELARWFASHQTEFARLDPGGAGIVTPDFETVREQVEERWRAERRAVETRRLADELARAWATGKKGPEAPGIVAGGPAWLTPSGPLPQGLTPELADSARSWTSSRRSLVLRQPGGFGAIGLVRYESRFHPPFEEIESQVQQAIERDRLAGEMAEARPWFEAHRERYRTGSGMAVLYSIIRQPPSIDVDLPADAVEREYQRHARDYGTPPEVRVRHILVTPESHGGDERARAFAQSLLDRIRKGEDFAGLAAQFSEDPGSQAKGGDLGYFSHGRMIPEFEKAAFALTKEHPVSDVVKSSFGYHILLLEDRREGGVPTLNEVRPRILNKLVAAQADSLARKEAEQLIRGLRTASEFARKVERSGHTLAKVRWYEGQPSPSVALDPLLAAARGLPAGNMIPGVQPYAKIGYVVGAVDSTLEPRNLDFEEARSRLIEDRGSERTREMAARHAEKVAADLRSGKSWVEATETIGGTPDSVVITYGSGIPGRGPQAGLDSLVFGPGPGMLAEGSWGRIPTSDGDVFVQLLRRESPGTPEADELQRLMSERVATALQTYVEDLKKQYRVSILRPDLAPPSEASPTSRGGAR